MGLSATFGLKLAADAAYSRGDKVEGDRLMREYRNALARAEREKKELELKRLESKRREIERKKKLDEERKKKIEEERKKIK